MTAVKVQCPWLNTTEEWHFDGTVIPEEHGSLTIRRVLTEQPASPLPVLVETTGNSRILQIARR
jgi:hypothetical protein